MQPLIHLKYAGILCLMAGSALADGHTSTRGDAAIGEHQFNRQCGACHVVRNDAGEILAGRNSRPGPNLISLAGRRAASRNDALYGDSLAAVGEAGLVWTQDAFVAYVQDPTGWLRETLQDRRARSKMSYRVRQEDEAYDLYAFLASTGQ